LFKKEFLPKILFLKISHLGADRVQIEQEEKKEEKKK
jgi:hypothetical protein